jgi:RNA polymerase sigma factor (sigma-70 family)
MGDPDPLEEYLRHPSRRRLSSAVRAHYEFVWTTAHRMTGNEEDARDICQDVFLKLLLEPPAPGSVSSARGFLTYRVLGRVEHLRRSIERRREREKEYARRLAEGGLRTEETEADRDALYDSIRILPEDLRRAVELRYLGGFSSQEIASALGVSERTVERRLEEAHDRMKRRLQPLWAAVPFLGEGLQGHPIPPPPSDLLPGLMHLCRLGTALAPSAAGANGTWMGIGALIMSGKKVVLVAVVCLLSLLGGVLIVHHLHIGRRSDDRTASRTNSESKVVAPGTVPAPRALPVKKALSSAEKAIEPTPGGEAQAASIQGRITDGAGTGVSRARVLALPVDKWQAIAREGERQEKEISLRGEGEDFQAILEAYRAFAKGLPETRSGDDGTYIFRGLSEGTHKVLVGHFDYLPSTDSQVAVRAGIPARCDVDLVPAMAIAGKVVDEAGHPVPGAEIEEEIPEGMSRKGKARIRQLREEWIDGRILVGRPKAASGPDGTFRLASLEPGRYLLTARKEEFLGAEAYGVPAGARDVILTLSRGSVLRGRVLDPEKRPLASARVTVEPEGTGEVHRFILDDIEPSPGESARPRAQTGKDGRFEIGGLSAGRFELRTTAEGFPPLKKDILIMEDTFDAGDLVLEAPRSISGSVHEPDGKPAAGARVWIEEPTRRATSLIWYPPAGRVATHETSSGADGSFLLACLPSGTFRVKASANGYAPGVAERVEGGAKGVKIVLRRGLTVQGTVVDDETSEPIEGAEVEIGALGEQRTITDASGEFEIRGIADPGSTKGWTFLRVSHPGYKLYDDYHFVRHGWTGDQPHSIRLLRRETVKGRVTDPGGQPVAGAKVWFEIVGFQGSSGGEYAGKPPALALSAEDGSFSLPVPVQFTLSITVSLANPLVFVAASHPASGVGRSTPIPIPASGGRWPGDVAVVLASGCAVEGSVTDEEGRPIGGAKVRLKRLLAADPKDNQRLGSIQALLETYSRSEGSYRISGVERGEVEVKASAVGYALQMIPQLEVEGDLVRQDIVLIRGGTVEGKVTDSGGNPLGNSEVVAFLERGGEEGNPLGYSEFYRRMSLLWAVGPASARTGPDGRFRLECLAPGAYTVAARCEGYEAAKSSPVHPGDPSIDLVLTRYSAVRGTVVASDTKEPIQMFTVEVLDRSKMPPVFEKLKSLDGSNLLTALGEKELYQLHDYVKASEGCILFQDPSGRFLFDGLQPGSYILLVAAAGFDFRFHEVVLKGGQETVAEVALERGGSIEGRVLDAETGVPIPAAEVDCFVEEVALMVRPSTGSIFTDEEGTFAIGGLSTSAIFGPQKGTYRIRASHPLYLKGSSPLVEVAPGERASVELRLSPAGRLEGTIRGIPRSFEGQKSILRELVLKKAGSKKQIVSDGCSGLNLYDDGTYWADSLEPGTYLLSIQRQEIELGKEESIGPIGVQQTFHPKGPEEVFPLGEVEIQARKTTRFDAAVP